MKSRVVAEIIAQAAARGERVLLLAPNAAALDCVLERIGARESLCPVRCLTPDERPEALPACIRRLTFAERLRSFSEQTLGAARRAHDEARQQSDLSRRDETVWPRLETTLERLTRLDAEIQSLLQKPVAPAADTAVAHENPGCATAVPAVSEPSEAGQSTDPTASPFQAGKRLRPVRDAVRTL